MREHPGARVTQPVRPRSLGVRFLRISVCGATLACAAALCAAAGAASEAANRARALREAQALVGRVELPAGAVRLRSSPGGDAAQIDNPFPRQGTPDVADAHAWWRVGGRPQDVLARVVAPRGARTDYTGSGGEKGSISYWYRAYALPPIPGVLASREIVVKVTALGPGEVAVRVDGQAIWIVPRPASERVPAGAGAIEITRARPHRAPTVDVTVTRPALVARITTVVNSLPTAQPGVLACPALLPGSPVVTLTFRRNGSTIARASQIADVPSPTTSCDAMTLTIGGRTQTPLLGGIGLLRLLGALLHVTLTK